MPLTIDPADVDVGSFNFVGVGRLRPGVTPEASARDLTALVPRIPEEYPAELINAGMIEQAKLGVLVHPLRDDVVGEVRGLLWILLGAVGVMLLIACANVANLFLVRAEGRQREIAVRTALGASRGDLARVFLGESLLLAVAGGALGLPLAAGGLELLLRAAPEGSLPRARRGRARRRGGRLHARRVAPLRPPLRPGWRCCAMARRSSARRSRRGAAAAPPAARRHLGRNAARRRPGGAGARRCSSPPGSWCGASGACVASIPGSTRTAY